MLLISLLTIAGLTASAAPSTGLTREDLLKGASVPERRVYPANPKISPCENFYEHVCSKVRDSFTLPEDRSRWTFSFTDASERLLHAKKRFFKALEKGYVPRSERARQTRDYYKACMNAKAAVGEERNQVEVEKKAILGTKTAAELADLAQARMDSPDESYLAFFDIPNQSDPTRLDIALWADARTLPERSYYHKPEVMKDFEVLVADFFRTVGVDRPEERAKMVVAFEKELAEKAPLPSEIRIRFAADTYMDRKELLKAYPNLKLERFLAKLPEGTKIRRVVPENLEFFERSLKEKSLDQLQSVYLYQSLSGVLDDSAPAFQKKSFDFQHKHLGGPAKRPDRQERCTRTTMSRFGMEIDEELISAMFPDFPEDRVVALVDRVRSSLLKELEANTWLSAQAKAEAKRKTASARLFLVKPKKDGDWDFNLPAVYDPKTPLANARLWQQKSIEKTFKELAEPRNRDRWEMGPLVLNAYFSPADNKFVMLQGILQYPFFDPKLSDIENIAAIGSVVGHELGHGIDDQGSKYDADGKLKQWMTEADLKEFRRRGQLFVERFDKAGHNGQLTLGENIGDHVGLTAAFAAAFPEGSKASDEDRRKFFTSYARVWCGKSRPAAEEQQLKTGPHSLGWARVNEQVIHQPAFAAAFSCKAGDKMFLSESERLRVW